LRGADRSTSFVDSSKSSLIKAREPQVRCLLPSPDGYVLADDPMCQLPLRLRRTEAGQASDSCLSYGRYFRAIRDVISRDTYRPLVDATARQLEEDISLADIEQILIYAEKHGSDYHPARIEVSVDDACAAFVMNVAVTARGMDRLCREFDVLKHLNDKYDFSFLPQTYFRGEAFCSAGRDGGSMLMFLADWFKGYHEFHLSIDENHGLQKLVVWDVVKGHQYLSPSQARQVYRQAAKVMTLYYDIETFEQIFPWHHAAGDFVVKTQDKSLDVRLVTARQYAPMLGRSEEISVHEALLSFLLNLSVRMRLDRLDGVGAVAWADEDCVQATVGGFIEGLWTREQQGIIDGSFVDGFLRFCRSLAQNDLSDGCHALIDACDPSAPDMPVIRTHLESHVRELHTALHKFRLGDFSPRESGK
jgi:hypothetical protein